MESGKWKIGTATVQAGSLHHNDGVGMFDQPIFFKPLMMERVWGGNRLGELFGKAIPSGKIIGESWELVDRPEAQSVADGGAFEGMTLRALLEQYPREIMGELAGTGRFPLLVKYVDAGDALSVQVHPDDAGAAAFDDLGKSECWAVVRAEPGARIVRGLKAGTTREMYARAVAEHRVEEVLHSFEPRVGDVVALPAGMVHAIGAGLTVAEIQQNSDLTFRIYDYKRLGLDGKPRKLHVEEAHEAIRFEGPGPEFEGDMHADTVSALEDSFAAGAREEFLLDGKYFDLMRWTCLSGKQAYAFKRQGRAQVALVLEGEGVLNGREVKAGMTGLLPAAMKEIVVVARTRMVLLLSAPKGVQGLGFGA